MKNGGILVVRRKAQKGKLVPSTKTKKLRRMSLPAAFIEQLTLYRALLTAAQLQSGLMFPSSVGKPVWNSRITKALKSARKRAGIRERFTSHGFRRSATDFFREAGIDPGVAKANTGHATDRMREHYSTIRDADLQRAGDVAGQLFAPAPSSFKEGLRTRSHARSHSLQTERKRSVWLSA